MFFSRRAIEIKTLDVYLDWYIWISCKFLKTETDLYMQYKPFYLTYWFCLWPVWPLSLWFHFLIKVLFMWMLICCRQDQYYAMNAYGFYLQFKTLCLSSLILFHDLILVLVWYVITFLWMKASNQKITKTIPIFF